MPKPNDRIGPYELIRKLGKGAFGEVWLAHDVDNLVASAPAVALKLPLDDDVDLDAIRQEATVWVAASGHPNVLPMLEARLYDGQVVIASEYAPDGSLQQWLKAHGGKAPSQAAALEMTRGILAGLAHLHSRRIVHRDLKPDNILLKGVTPRLADFGLSRVLRSTSMSAVVAGTPVYMAPEAFKGRRNPQTDLWSVGVMLYQMLSGRFPFLSNDKYELYVRITNDEPAPIEAPPWLQQVVVKALSKNPAERFQTAEEVQAALVEPDRLHIPYITAKRSEREEQWLIEGRLPQQEQQLASEFEAAKAAQRRASQTTQLDKKRPKQQPLSLSPQTEPTALKPAPRVDLSPAPKKSSGKMFAVLGALVLSVSGIIYWVNRSNSSGEVTPAVAPVARNATLPNLGDEFTETKNNLNLVMKRISGGSFMMGSPDSETDIPTEKPQHEVTVSDFYIGKYEITQAQWRAVMGTNPSYFKGNDLPVEQVSWKEAIEFCHKLSQMTGKAYRLPTEAEREYAARAGTTGPYAGELDSMAWYNKNSGNKTDTVGQTHPFGQKKPNAFGLFDMHGNVYEWCEDVWHDNYDGAPNDGSSWLSGGDSTHHVLRGGSWGSGSGFCRSAARSSDFLGDSSSNDGFRVVVGLRTP